MMYSYHVHVHYHVSQNNYDVSVLHCSPVSKLTVGARALSKHHHRDESASWWGNSTGCEYVCVF